MARDQPRRELVMRARLGLHLGPVVFTSSPPRRRRRPVQPDWFRWAAGVLAVAIVITAYMVLGR